MRVNGWRISQESFFMLMTKSAKGSCGRQEHLNKKQRKFPGVAFGSKLVHRLHLMMGLTSASLGQQFMLLSVVTRRRWGILSRMCISSGEEESDMQAPCMVSLTTPRLQSLGSPTDRVKVKARTRARLCARVMPRWPLYCAVRTQNSVSVSLAVLEPCFP